MKKTILFALLASSTAALAFAGCSSTNSSTAGDGGNADSTTGEDSPSGDTGTTGDTGAPPGDSGTTTDAPADAGPPPSPPTLGAQIDRMGRPAINTALNHTFDPTCYNNADAGPGSCNSKDAYNQDNGPTSNWSVPPNPDGGAVTGYFAQFFGNLAIYDSLDGVCGNQAGYNFTSMGTTYPAYSTLATVFSQDALWVNTNSSTCGVYLGVELNTLGVSNGDCGGRTLTENVMDETYSLLSGDFSVSDAGVPSFPVSNGITTPSAAPMSTFPYVAAPQ